VLIPAEVLTGTHQGVTLCDAGNYNCVATVFRLLWVCPVYIT